MESWLRFFALALLLFCRDCCGDRPRDPLPTLLALLLTFSSASLDVSMVTFITMWREGLRDPMPPVPLLMLAPPFTIPPVLLLLPPGGLLLRPACCWLGAELIANATPMAELPDRYPRLP